MANKVFANGNELACKAGAGKVIAGFPDVCLSPPSPPAGPIPIPYPNTAKASDTDGGSKTVKISGEEVMLKDKSRFKKSTGDEAATQSQGKGVVSHEIKGQLYFAAWSMDVKIEGENAVRHMDLTTGNHACQPGNRAVPWNFQDTAALDALANAADCKDSVDEYKKACAGKSPKKCGDECRKAQKCILLQKKADKKYCCKPDNTGHHVVEVHCFTPAAGRGDKARLPGFEKYDDNKAPCVCASQKRNAGFHGKMHNGQGRLEAAHKANGKVLKTWPGAGPLNKGKRGDAVSNWTYGQARDAGVATMMMAAPHCDSECIKNQLDAYHKDECGIKEDDPVRTDPGAGTRSAGKLNADENRKVAEAVNKIKDASTPAAAPKL